MRVIVSFFAALILSASTALAAESHYEVYYFHASWRCTNCTNAEAWAGEAVSLLQKANPDVKIIYAPKQLEKNKALVSQTKAKRVDLVVAEVENEKIIRFENLGNLLNVISSKSLLIKTSIEGILTFDAKSKGGARLKPPDALAEPNQKAARPPAKIGVYVIMDGPEGEATPRAADIIRQVLSNDFPRQVRQQAVMASVIDSRMEQNKDWLKMFNARSGDVVVALIRNNAIENFSVVVLPKNVREEQGFIAAFTSAMKQNVSMGGL